jgi:hypothetical protein
MVVVRLSLSPNKKIKGGAYANTSPTTRKDTSFSNASSKISSQPDST